MVEAEVVRMESGTYVECAPGSGPVATEGDILELMAACGPGSGILLDERDLHPKFFDLSSGLAGAILGKLATYRVRAAVVADLDNIESERFQELIYELNKGNQFRFFRERAAAERWLTGH